MFADRLKSALDGAKKSRRWLADQLGVTESAITMVVNGQAKSMNAANCARAAKALNVHCLWLATGDGPMADAGTLLWRDVAINLATTLDTAERGQRFAMFVREVDGIVERAQMNVAADQTAVH